MKPWDVTYHKENADRILESGGMRRVLEAIGDDIIREANAHYERQAKGEETRPYIYTRSWKKRIVASARMVALDVDNTDPTARMVELGAHDERGRLMLGYAPLRNAIDAVKRKWVVTRVR